MTPAYSDHIGYLAQEPELDGKTVAEAIEPAVAKSRQILSDFEALNMKMCDPDCDMEQVTADLDEYASTPVLNTTPIAATLISLICTSTDAPATLLTASTCPLSG